MSSEERNSVLEWFSEKTDDLRILCNVSCIKEGVNVFCDMVVFCDEKASKVAIIQAIGRGIRKQGGKPDCLVSALIPWTECLHASMETATEERKSEDIDLEQDIEQENEVQVKAFRIVRNICLALKEQDSRVEEIMSGTSSKVGTFTIGFTGSSDSLRKMLS